MKLKNLLVITMIMSSLFYISINSVQAADVIIPDGTGDVVSIDTFTEKSEIVLDHPDIDVDNIDFTQATYSQLGIQATISFQVKGNIENRGKIFDPYTFGEDDLFSMFNTVQYEIYLETSENIYTISYSNNSGSLTYDVEQKNLTSSDFSVVGNTLSISFNLTNESETYSSLNISSAFIKIISNEEEPTIVWLSDVAPNPALAIWEAYAPNIGSIGENIQFNGSIEPFTGTPPFSYRWDFGDQKSSNERDPIHSYSKAGTYTYVFTVTDEKGATESLSGNITISDESGVDSDDNRMILLIAIILIIIVIGVVIIVWIIRRR